MFNFFNRNSTKISGSIFKPFRKIPEEIKLERIKLDKQIYASKTNDVPSKDVNNKQLLEAKKNLNQNQPF